MMTSSTAFMTVIYSLLLLRSFIHGCWKHVFYALGIRRLGGKWSTTVLYDLCYIKGIDGKYFRNDFMGVTYVYITWRRRDNIPHYSCKSISVLRAHNAASGMGRSKSYKIPTHFRSNLVRDLVQTDVHLPCPLMSWVECDHNSPSYQEVDVLYT